MKKKLLLNFDDMAPKLNRIGNFVLYIFINKYRVANIAFKNLKKVFLFQASLHWWI